MAKTRTFSIYLLKEGVTIDNALKEDHGLSRLDGNDSTLNELNITIYLSEARTTPPWWKAYLGIEQDLNQRQEGALAFIPCCFESTTRIFVLTFGMTYHKLQEGSYEYDFGLRATLNAIDPTKIKSTETVQPENAKRQRMQSPTVDTLSFFDFNRDQNIIKTLAGKVKPEYSEWVKSATGVNSIRITSSVEAGDLPSLCRQLYALYNRNDYEQTFPDLFNITPVKEPSIKQYLETALIDSYNGENHENLIITLPEMLDPLWNTFLYTYQKKCSSELSEHSILSLKTVLPRADSMEQFKGAKLQILNEDQEIIKAYPIEECFVFDCIHNSKHYHFCDGSWYCVNERYIQRIEQTLERGIRQAEDYGLPFYRHQNEGEYNMAVPSSDSSYICLDRSTIAPASQTQIEPCDLVRLNNEELQLFHIKLGTRSAMLSHLFNQGIVSLDLLRSEESSRCKLKEILNDRNLNDLDNYNMAIDSKNFSVIFGIVTHQEIEKGVHLLPLFSKISLYRVIKSLETRNTEWGLVFIPKEEQKLPERQQQA